MTDAASCSLTDSELKTRRALARRTLVPRVTGLERAPGRLMLRFTSDARDAVEDFVSLEQQCCGFLSFRIAPPNAPLTLTVEAPGDAEATLDLFAELAGDHLESDSERV